ncbi:MAG: S46 family peptidase [Bacteroidetes bacterium]|nr:S46 family peptidase [Bacteroidota bacterium]
MFRKITFLVLIALFANILKVNADEGMWIPLLLKNYNYIEMQKKGFKLTAEDVYSVNQACLKDAIVGLGNINRPFRHFCTGELISDQGLFITNHHCGFGYIQSHSSVEHDYLTDGFWAKSKDEELSNDGLTVSFLVRIEDVTEKVLANVNDTMNQTQRFDSINNAMKNIEKQAIEGTHYLAKVKSYFSGNQYFMSVYEVFKDVRLVGAPPSAIGKFGGDTDNWMWPRHTGDFSMFRIYADKENKPAEYSADNVPYKPKKHLPISLKGYKKGDFTMIFGYPGTTNEYLTSYAVNLVSKIENPAQIDLRKKRLEIMSADMNDNPEVRIKYASKYAGVANYWKKWIGENRGLQKLNAIEKKQELEKQFNIWANSNEELKKNYAHLLPEYKKLYEEITPYSLALDYVYEAAFAIEIVGFAYNFNSLERITKETPQEDVDKTIAGLKIQMRKFFKDYNLSTDKKIFIAMLKAYSDNMDEQFKPDIYKEINSKYKNDYNKYADYVYSKSFLVDSTKILNFLDKYSYKSNKKLQKDPSYKLFSSIYKTLRSDVYPKYLEVNNKIKRLKRFYVKGLQLMQSDKVFFPDANSTMRIAYGVVDDYFPRDAVHYTYFTTLKGIMEKDDPDVYDYKVPEKLKELYRNKDYGQYAQNDTMHICFTASNHTTGGNSGSPVINAEGQLIGINFDRNWEGTMSDIMYDPDQCRNISIDIRYALFLIDKFAGATNLIDEMTLVK